MKIFLEVLGNLHMYQLSTLVLMGKCAKFRWLLRIAAWIILARGLMLCSTWSDQYRS